MKGVHTLSGPRFWRSAMMAGLLFCLIGCGPSRQERIDAAEDKAMDQARDDMANQTYEEAEGSADCTVDCSGHDAGFAWAKENDIEDPDECSGNSESFIEGCKAYGEEIGSRMAAAADAAAKGKDEDGDKSDD